MKFVAKIVIRFSLLTIAKIDQIIITVNLICDVVSITF